MRFASHGLGSGKVNRVSSGTQELTRQGINGLRVHIRATAYNDRHADRELTEALPEGYNPPELARRETSGASVSAVHRPDGAKVLADDQADVQPKTRFLVETLSPINNPQQKTVR
jgi:hypothetical protein